MHLRVFMFAMWCWMVSLHLLIPKDGHQRCTQRHGVWNDYGGLGMLPGLRDYEYSTPMGISSLWESGTCRRFVFFDISFH